MYIYVCACVYMYVCLYVCAWCMSMCVRARVCFNNMSEKELTQVIKNCEYNLNMTEDRDTQFFTMKRITYNKSRSLSVCVRA